MTSVRASEAPDVDVIVVNWNARDELLECAESVFAQEGVRLSLIVVDNGSEDGSVEALRTRFPATRILETGENLGFAEGCNRGIALASAPWVFVLNNDARIEPGGLRMLLDAARAADGDVAALQPALVFKSDLERLNSAGITLHSDGTAIDRGFQELLSCFREAKEIFGATAGAALYRREAIERVALPSGVFDRTFFMYVEDVDLAWRLRLAGYRSIYVPSAHVAHRFHGSSDRVDDDFVARHVRRNRLRLLVKNASLAMMVRSLPVSALMLARTARNEGAQGIVDSARACLQAVLDRPRIARLAVRERPEIEVRWLEAPPVSLSTAALRKLSRRLGEWRGRARGESCAGRS